MVKLGEILITGGAGFIGSHLILKLLEKYKIICVDNMNTYYDVSLKEARLKLFKDKIKFYKVDIADKDELKKVFEENQITKICHLAAQAGVRYSMENPSAYAESNYVGTQNILEMARKYKLDVVFASTSSIYGLNKSPFKEDWIQKLRTTDKQPGQLV